MRSHWLGAATASALLAFGLAACGSGTPNSTAGGLQIWEGYTGDRGEGVRPPARRLEQGEPGREGHQLVRQQRRLAAEAADRSQGRQPARHRLRLRILGAEHRADPAGGQPDQGRAAARRQLVRLLGWRARRRDRERQGHRHPGAGRQPRGGLQQDAVRGRGPAAAGPGLDLEPVRRRREEADHPGEEAVRYRLRDARQRGHGLALGGTALGSRRRRS